MFQIGTLKLDNGLILAPMAGVTNLPFRLMIKRMGAELVTTEMVSAEGLIRGQKKSLGYLKSHPDEKPLAIQIFGSKPDSMARAAQMAADLGADIIDINMGCPIKKVTKTGAGASLLRDPKKTAEIVTAVRIVTPVPLTVKIRAGWSPEEQTALQISRIIQDCGADGLIVHPRFATHRFSKPADWNLIGLIKDRLSIPVIGNGDIFKASQALEMMDQTGCDGVMIGRGALGNPWLFHQIVQLKKGLPVQQPGLIERRAFIMEHFRALIDAMGERQAALVMRGLLLWYSKGLPQSSRFRGSISKINDLKTLVSILDKYFSSIRNEYN